MRLCKQRDGGAATSRIPLRGLTDLLFSSGGSAPREGEAHASLGHVRLTPLPPVSESQVSTRDGRREGVSQDYGFKAEFARIQSSSQRAR